MLSWSKHAGSEGSASNSGSLLFLVLAAFRDTTPSRVHLDMRSCQRPLELDPPVLHLSWRVGFSRPFLWRFKLWSETSICTRMQTRRLQISKSEWGVGLWEGRTGRNSRAETNIFWIKIPGRPLSRQVTGSVASVVSKHRVTICL